VSSMDPTVIGALRRLDQARQVLADAHTMLRSDAGAVPDIDDLVETGTLVAAVTEQLTGVNMRMIAAALPRYLPVD
jgi:hypothetical protein